MMFQSLRKHLFKINDLILCVIFIPIYWTKSKKVHSILSHHIYQFLLGIQLNNRKKEEEKKAAAAVTTKPSSLNVMAITEQAAKYRRDKIRPQSESENEDESSRWDDSD